MQIVEAFINEKGQRRQRIVQHLGVACDDMQLQNLWDIGEKLIPVLEARAKEEKLFATGQLSLFDCEPEEYERPVPDDETVRVKRMSKGEDILEGPFEVWGEVFDKIGAEGILGLSDRGRGSTNALKLCLIAKLTDGGSKARSALWIEKELGLPVSEDRFYRMMDRLSEKIDRVKELGFRCGRYLCGNKVTLLLFDVTTLYFESFIDDEDNENNSPANVKLGLRRHGFSKDCKFKETQVVLALAASSEGIPLWYELFPGNTAESATLKNMMDEMSSRIKPDEVWVVADGAMLTKENRTILNEAGTGWVLGASVKKLSQEYQEQALDMECFSELDEGRKYRVINLESGNTLIVTYSDKKARKDVYDRDRAIKKLLKRLDKRGEISGKTAIGNRGVSRYIELSDGTGDIKYKLNQEKIEKEARFDGLHGVETDRRVETYEDVREVLSAYGNLWHIEDCFRVSKSDLQIRPVYHWTERRIKAHVAICFLALLMERYLECQLMEKRRIRLSAARIKAALLKVNSTMIKASDSGKLYRFPSRLPKEAREIYKSLGLKRGIEPTEIMSMMNYRRRIPNIRFEVSEEEIKQ